MGSVMGLHKGHYIKAYALSLKIPLIKISKFSSISLETFENSQALLSPMLNNLYFYTISILK